MKPGSTDVLMLRCELSVLQVCYAKELKEGFVEYTEQVVKLMVPLLKFYFHDDILCPWCSHILKLVLHAVAEECGLYFLNWVTGAGSGSRVHAPASGVCPGPGTGVPHSDVALHV